MIPTLYGSQKVLSATNPWLAAIVLYVFTIAIAYLGRWLFEGRAYNVAFSSKYGDVALIGCIWIAGSIFHRTRLLPAWTTSPTFHIAIATLAVAIGIIVGSYAIYESTWAKSEIIDMAHNFLIVPLYLYLLGTTLPVVYFQGTWLQKSATVALLLIWFGLVVFDTKTGRMKQQDWLKAQGITL